MTTVDVKLSRPDRQPWGFRLHGGSDCGSPLSIQKVNSESLSEAAGLEAGDLLLAVSGQQVEGRTHKEVLDTIVRAGNSLTLTVRRGTVLNQRPLSGRQTPLLSRHNGAHNGAGDWDRVLQSNRAGAADNAEDFTKEFMSQLMGNSAANLPQPIRNNTVQPPPVGGTQQQGVRAGDWDRVLQSNRAGAADNAEDFTREFMSQLMGGSTIPPTVLHDNASTQNIQNNNYSTARAPAPVNQVHSLKPVIQQYNSPQPLYSQENVEEVLNQQAEVLANGVKGIDFNSYSREPKVLHNSEVLKLLREQEAGLDRPRAQSASRENRNNSSAPDLRMNNVHNVQAPKYSQRPAAPAKTSPAPAVSSVSSTLPRERQVERRITIRRSESPATRPRPRSSASPAMGRNTISRRGQNNFQWPPVRSEEQGLPTAVPIYISPHSRNSSRNSSPAPQRDGVNRYQTTAIPVTINRNN